MQVTFAEGLEVRELLILAVDVLRQGGLSREDVLPLAHRHDSKLGRRGTLLAHSRLLGIVHDLTASSTVLQSDQLRPEPDSTRDGSS